MTLQTKKIIKRHLGLSGRLPTDKETSLVIRNLVRLHHKGVATDEQMAVLRELDLNEEQKRAYLQ